MTEQIVDIMEANMPVSSDVAAVARSAGGAAGGEAAGRVVGSLRSNLSRKVDKSGVGQISMLNLSNEVKEALTGGSVAVVGEDCVGVRQFVPALKVLYSRVATRLSFTGNTGTRWVVGSSGSASRTEVMGWSSASIDVSGGELVRVRLLRGNGTGACVIVTDASLKSLVQACDGGASGEHEWHDVWVNVPTGGAHLLVNAWNAAEFNQTVDVLVEDWTLDAPVHDVMDDYGAVADFRHGLLADRDSLVLTLGASSYNKGFGFQNSSSSPNGGMITSGWMESASNRVLIHVAGAMSLQQASIQINVRTSTHSSNTYRNIHSFTGPVFDEWVLFDAASYAVYEDMQSFRVLVNATKGTGWCRIDRLEVADLGAGGVRGHALYRPRLDEQLQAIFDRLDQIDADTDTGGGTAEGAGTLVAPDGSKWSLTVDADGTLGTVGHTPSNILFMGNSLLLGMAGSAEGTGKGFGMCASSKDKDWASIVGAAITAKNSGAEFDRLHCAAFEQAETDQVAQEYITTNQNRWSGKDLVILQIGDNANNDTRRATFARNLPKLVASIRAGSPSARVILLGIWFTNDTNVRTMQETAAAYGCGLVRIDDLNVKANQATEGQLITYPDGTTTTAPAKWVTHPGDQGMQAIADRIIQTLDM